MCANLFGGEEMAIGAEIIFMNNNKDKLQIVYIL